MDESASRISETVESTAEEFPLDDTFAILADRQRRHLLAVLSEMESPEPLSALTRSLATVLDRSDTDEVERLHIRLYHCHVPKLEDAGIVSYDEDEDAVELTEGGRALAAGLEQKRGRESPRLEDSESA